MTPITTECSRRSVMRTQFFTQAATVNKTGSLVHRLVCYQTEHHQNRQHIALAHAPLAVPPLPASPLQQAIFEQVPLMVVDGEAPTHPLVNNWRS